MNNNNGIKKECKLRKEYERVFTVKESYSGKKNLSEIFADLLHSEYCKQEAESKGNKLNRKSVLQGNGIIPA